MSEQKFETVRIDGHDVPVVPLIHNRILREIEKEPDTFDMRTIFHCGTRHCYAGWAIHLAGGQGYALQEAASFGAKLIIEASCPWLKIDWYSEFQSDIPNDVALERIRERAVEERRRLHEG